ncbi:MAG: AAA family ATPase [Mollicutes bacterium]|nr:AAA family ATPase [Mollicutes bacterium]
MNHKTNKPYAVVAFVGENGCGKTTILNEIFNYEKSNYIVDKEVPYSFVEKPFDALYLRQGSLHRNAMKEVRKLIDGKDMYPTNSATYQAGATPFGLRSNNAVNRINEGSELLAKLGDEEILKIFKEKHIDEVWCSNDVTKKIDGKEHGYNITNYSSGQQEILLKLKDIRQMSSGTDCVLLDEPETSLHPRWQKEIVNLIRLLVSDANGYAPQIFLATHSEKVLEALISSDDVLIIRLFKENGNTKSQTINEMDLRLPTPTFAELDYVVFNIASLEYHDQLWNTFGDLSGTERILGIDKTIRKLPSYSKEKYGKIWLSSNGHSVTTYKTLPAYIRNYFHHPKEGKEPTEEEIIKSIEFLREAIKTKLSE